LCAAAEKLLIVWFAIRRKKYEVACLRGGFSV
jgi:hypothetical protein